MGHFTKLPETMEAFRVLDMQSVGAHAYRWRFNLKTGEVKEGPIEEQISEFGMINPRVAGEAYRYCWGMTTRPGWFLFNGIVRLDVETGQRQSYTFPEGVYASESPMAPVAGRDGESDGYVVSYVTDMNKDTSSCVVFDAAEIDRGPIAEIKLPQRICVGTHSYWAGSDTLAPSSS